MGDDNMLKSDVILQCVSDLESLSPNDFLKQLRLAQKQKMSINRLAGLSGYSTSHISRIEKGGPDAPRITDKYIKAVAPHLGIDVNYLLKVTGIIESEAADGPVELRHLLLTNEIKHDGKVLNNSHKEGIVKIYNTVLAINKD